MLIQCTKKLLDELGIKQVESVEEKPLFSWHANLIRINRRKTVVLCNDKNRYVVVLYGLKAGDFDNFAQRIKDKIRKTFQDENIKDEIIEQYMNSSQEIVYTKTKNRSMIAKLNEACKVVNRFPELLDEHPTAKSRASLKCSRFLVGDGNNSYYHPNRMMYEDLENLTGTPIFDCQVVKLKVTLKLDSSNVWRRILVPINYTFVDLHRIIQEAFSWKDYHLHEFYIYDHNNKPVVNLVCSEEAFDFEMDLPMQHERGIRLSEYIPEYKLVRYVYDFGDNWEHIIEVEEIIGDYDKNHPICLEGEGSSPPEDVGGDYGFEEFLKIIEDSNHPQHERMLKWGKRQGYSDFDIKFINMYLKDI